MDGIVCHRCGEGLLLESNVRYRLEVRIQAAYDPMEITKDDLERDLEAEIEATIRQLEKMSLKEAERQVHFEGKYDLCARCQKEFLDDPVFKE